MRLSRLKWQPARPASPVRPRARANSLPMHSWPAATGLACRKDGAELSHLGFSRPHCTEKQFSHRSPPGPSTTYNTLFTYRTAESIPCFRQYLTPTVLTTETLVTLYFYWFSALQAHITRLNSEKMKYSQPSVGTSKLGALCCALSFTTSTQRAR